jgi:hypothetical protein
MHSWFSAESWKQSAQEALKVVQNDLSEFRKAIQDDTGDVVRSRASCFASCARKLPCDVNTCSKFGLECKLLSEDCVLVWSQGSAYGWDLAGRWNLTLMGVCAGGGV